MPVNVTANKKTYASTKKNHAEELMFAITKNTSGNLDVSMDGWPCTGERGHNCHQLFKDQSAGRTITVSIGADHAGYARNHGKAFGATGTITYTNGAAVYS